MALPPPPNLDLDNPLAQQELHHRIHACMLARGFTHARLAREMSVQWTSLKRWLTGEQDIGLQPLIKVSSTLEYTLEELVFGLLARQPSAPGPVAHRCMTTPELRAYLDRHQIPNEVRLGLMRALKSQEFEILAIDDELVGWFCEEYRLKLKEGPDQALEASVTRVLGSLARVTQPIRLVIS